MKMLCRHFTKLTAVGMAIIYFYSQVLAPPLAQASFWSERRQAVQDMKRGAGAGRDSVNTFALGAHSTLASLPQLPGSAFPDLNFIPPVERVPLAQPKGFTSPATAPAPPSSILPQVSPTILHRYPVLGALPLAFGAFKGIHLAPSRSQSPLVLHLQDVHMNPEAQFNIAASLEALLKGSGAADGAGLHSSKLRSGPVIGVEAAHGAFNFQPFRAFPHSAITYDVATHLVKQGELAAASYVGITAPEDYSARFWGVDDPVQYKANVEAIKLSKTLQPAYQARLETLQTQIAQLKATRLNPPLRALEAQVSAYREGRVSLGRYAETLALQGRADTLSQLQRFLEVYHREKTLNFSQVERERQILLARLIPKLHQAVLSQLMAQSVAYRSGQITYAAYYRYLETLCAQHGIPLRRYPAMQAYIQYVLQADRINAEELFHELAEAEDAALTALVQTPAERQLLTLVKQLTLMGRLVRLELTPDQWAAWQPLRTSLQHLEEEIQAFRTPSPFPLPWWERATLFVSPRPPKGGEGGGEGATTTDLAPFEQFYHAAEARDEAMVTNLLAQMKATGSSTGILIAGGFHSQGIARLLKDRQISYVSLAPKITKLDTADGTKYLDVFVREKTPLEKLFTGEKLFVQHAGAVPGALGPFIQPTKTVADYGTLQLIGNAYHWLKERLKQASVVDLRLAKQELAKVALSVSSLLGTAGLGSIELEKVGYQGSAPALESVTLQLTQTAAPGASRRRLQIEGSLKGQPRAGRHLIARYDVDALREGPQSGESAKLHVVVRGAASALPSLETLALVPHLVTTQATQLASTWLTAMTVINIVGLLVVAFLIARAWFRKMKRLRHAFPNAFPKLPPSPASFF
ncbi:MAG: hypothetical protein HYZ73_01440 [Elusimicrobia bacterium]|nr:hypothetical protein [Elusimicrobiota bacterium]